MTTFKEAIIPPFIWSFVKTVSANPIKAGILALIISRYMTKNKKKEGYSERLDILMESWKSIGANPKANKTARWQNSKGDTLYITKKVWPDKTNYAVGLNAKILSQWFDDLPSAMKYAKSYMTKNKGDTK